jgi:hypothetical protein
MNIWIVTTGSSDVQFTADDDKWNRLYRKVRSQINTSHKFSPTPRPNDDTGEAFLVPARVMGMVYEEQLEDNYGDLCFPLLDAFQAKLQGENTPNRIIVILTDQEQVFTAQDRKERNCPYWQDTCKLRPIIEKYLNDKFPSATVEEPIYLKPQSKEEGLDNWDKALALVTKELSKIKVDEKDNIYVSHQASTPAISSAVQFVSLARFGKQVQFLVSNEYEKKPLDLIESSEYLRGIQIQEAKALLKRYDYEGVKDLLSPYWKKPPTPLEQKISELLEMAIQWNRAEFKEFGDLAKDKVEGAKEHINQPWVWWIGYESAYLAVVRLEQENTVEALFHSFRAAEGLICEWAIWRYKKHIEYDKKNSPQIKISVLDEVPDYLNSLPPGIGGRFKSQKRVGLFSTALYKLLQQARPEYQHDCHIRVVWEVAAEWRNERFHRLLGLQEEEVFEAWNTNKRTDWEARVLGCLNFIAKPKQPFTSLKEASLMFQVHKKLEDAIAQYEGNEHTS